MANRKFIEAWCKKKVREIERIITDELPNQIAKDAKRNFKSAEKEVPSADWYVDVWASKRGANSAEVVCGGTQVLFIEFGAGNAHKDETSTVVRSGMYDVEYASRPAGIVSIGQFGKGYGKDSSWVFKDVNYIIDNGVNHTHWLKQNSRGEFIYRTGGIRPVRALYRAIATGVKKITVKRIRRLGQ